MSNMSPTALLLNVGHALDHLFLLIFATAVAAIAAEWGLSWQEIGRASCRERVYLCV